MEAVERRRSCVEAGVDHQGAADGGVLAEILAGHLASQDQAVRRLEGRIGVAGQDRQGHHLEEAGIGPDNVLADGDVPTLEVGIRDRQPGDLRRLGEVEPEISGHGRDGPVDGARFRSGESQIELQAVDLLPTGNEPLEADLVADVEADQDRRGEAGRQAEDGDGGIESVAADVADGGGDVVSQHDEPQGFAPPASAITRAQPVCAACVMLRNCDNTMACSKSSVVG